MVIDWANRVNKRASLTFSNFQKRRKTNEIMKWSTLYNDILTNTQTGDFKNYAVWNKVSLSGILEFILNVLILWC